MTFDESCPGNFNLVADVGGTNSRIGLCCDGDLLPDTIKRYRNADFRDFVEVITAYRAEIDTECGAAVIAVAGPVEAGTAVMTNLGWGFDELKLSADLGIGRVHLVNDLQAQGYGIQGLPPQNVRRVIDGEDASAKWPALVVGVGTGLNATVVHETPSGLFATASESGHIRLCLNRSETVVLANAAEFVSMEDVVSGRGLASLHKTLHGSGKGRLTGPEIVAAAIKGDHRSVTTTHLFLDILGGFIGDLALIHLPFGGIYISGGVGRAIAPVIEASGFEASFRDKGRFSDLMRRFSVSLLLDDYAALRGAARALSDFSRR